MAYQKKKPDPPPGVPAYMLTWGDLCTLLMCFFVLLVAMSTTDPAKFKVAASSIQNALSGVLESLPTIMIHQDITMPRLGGSEQNKHLAADAAMKIQKAVKQENLDEAIKVKITETGVAIQIADPIGFDVGESDVKPELIATLQSISDIVGKVPGTMVRVEGHTDDIPIHTAKFPSNWELSASRALNVVKFIAQSGKIDPAQLSAIGYGEYRPLVPNTSAGNRKTNRRIEIFVDYTQKNTP